MRDLRRELEEAPGGGYSELVMWQPEPGDIITGRLAGYQTRTTKRGPARIAVIDVEENEPLGVCGERVGVWVAASISSTSSTRCPANTVVRSASS
jgi:hypothetical protein